MKKLSKNRSCPTKYGETFITDTRWVVFRRAACQNPKWGWGDAKTCPAPDHEIAAAGAVPFDNHAPSFIKNMPAPANLLLGVTLPWHIVSPQGVELVCVYRAPETAQERAKVTWVSLEFLENVARCLDISVGELDLSMHKDAPDRLPLGIRVRGYDGYSGFVVPYQVNDTTPLAEALIATETEAALRQER